MTDLIALMRQMQFLREEKWNYTQPVFCMMAVVRLLPVEDPELHWQNAFAGQERQVMFVKDKGSDYAFVIDNEDGSAVNKIAHGGGPDSGHKDVAGFEFIREVLPHNWNTPNPIEGARQDEIIRAWQRNKNPELFERMGKMMAAHRRKAAPVHR